MFSVQTIEAHSACKQLACGIDTRPCAIYMAIYMITQGYQWFPRWKFPWGCHSVNDVVTDLQTGTEPLVYLMYEVT